MLTSDTLDAFARDYYLNGEMTTVGLEERAQLHSVGMLVEAIDGRSPVLEMGFGTGLITGELLDRGVPLQIVEGSPVLATEARRRHDGLSVHEAMFETFAPTEAYGAVLALHVLEHVDDPVELLATMRSWLAPGGALIAVVPNAESLHRRIAVEMGLHPNLDDLSDSDILVGHQRVYDLQRLVADLERAGYEVDLDFGYLLKTVPNSMMLDYPNQMVDALNTISSAIPTRDLANIGVRAIPRSDLRVPLVSGKSHETGLASNLVPRTPPGLLTAVVLAQAGEQDSEVEASVSSVEEIADTVVVLDGAAVDWEDPAVTAHLLDEINDAWILVLAAGERLRTTDPEAAMAALGEEDVDAIGVQVGLSAEVRLHRNTATAISGIGAPSDDPSRVMSIATGRPRTTGAVPAVTVIVPTFNRPEMLRRCLEGICVQTDDDLEVIVVNDGGIDVSAVVDAFENRLAVGLITRDHNGGAATAANAGLSAARGRYAHFQADDDTVLPHHIELLRSALDDARASAEPAGVVFGPAFMIEEDDTGTERTRSVVFREAHSAERLLWQNFIVGGTAMFDRQIACDIGGMNTEFEVLEDWDFWLRMSQRAAIHYVDTPTAEYRLRPGTANVTTQARPRFYRSLLKLYEDHPVDEDSEVAAQRQNQQQMQSSTHEEAYAWDLTVGIIGNGDLQELVGCLNSVLSTHGSSQVQVIVHELRTPAADQLLRELARDATVCLHAHIDDEICRRRIERQTGGRTLIVLDSTDRLAPAGERLTSN